MYPVLFKFGPITIYTFSLILVLAFFLALYATWTKAKEDECEFLDIADIFLATFLAGLLGGRVLEVLVTWNQFSRDFLGIASFWSHPGFSVWGAIIGGGVGSTLLARRKRLNILKVFDYLSYGAGFALPILFLGHALSGSYYGKETSFFWGISNVTIFGRRHPTAILGFVLFLTVFLAISKLTKRSHAPGFLFLFELCFFSLIIFFLEFLRGDVPTFDRKLVNIAFSLVAFSTSLNLLYLLSKRSIKGDVQLVASATFKTPGLIFHLIAKILPKKKRVPLKLRRRFF